MSALTLHSRIARRSTRTSSLARVLAAASLAACSDSLVGPSNTIQPRGFVVLNGYGQQGVTVAGDTGATTARIDFGASFDGGSMSLLRDTVISTSSRSGGDQLYVASLTTGSLVRVQMPAASNPAGTTFTGGFANVNAAVALRDSGAIALVKFGATPTTTLIRKVGRCPSDVAVQGSSFWVVDANLNCDARGYTPQGDSRLIRTSADGSGNRDTVVLTGTRSAGSILVINNVAYVTSSGEADFSNYPVTIFKTPGSITRVDLESRRVLDKVSLPAGTYGAGLHLGGDGRFYVTVYTKTDFTAQDVFAFDASLSSVGVRAAGKQSLALTLANGSAPVCSAATADVLGRVYCASNGAASATTVYVFDVNGALLRTVAAGQGAVDIDVR